ncbi:hypothetical protein [Chitinophaga sp.]|uniref:hypothetical protein n=1 Tax=Chitinophaga sp. TaxID=1869181 RepID=UPI002C2AF8C3|nr:hypothetical protein [Chitinophaga sp.]HWV66160.1 hypothetical protein [Chitinophaga sp.]
MKKILFLFLLAGLFYACKKDKIGTKPILSFKGYSVDSVSVGIQDMFVTLNVQDGDGDIEDTLQIAPIYDTKIQDTFYIVRRMPEIGANRGNSVKAEVAILLETQDFRTYQSLNDSIHFLIFIRDNAGNFSDTIATPKIPYNIP